MRRGRRAGCDRRSRQRRGRIVRIHRASDERTRAIAAAGAQPDADPAGTPDQRTNATDRAGRAGRARRGDRRAAARTLSARADACARSQSGAGGGTLRACARDQARITHDRARYGRVPALLQHRE